ncbi:MAG: formate dehydrogenase accessory sulfurtransferase FdhD [Verrucomicrobiota bacterium]
MPKRASNHASPEIAVARVTRYESGRPKPERDDALAVEEPLEIRVRGRSIAVTMRTPGHDAELAAGFLLTEGLVRQRSDILEIAHCKRGEATENTLNVFLAPSVKVNFAQLTRHVFASSSCGLCGKASIESVQQQFAPIGSTLRITAQALGQIAPRLRRRQATFEQTGGLHAAALFTARGQLVVLREDIGRHNAVDKVVGHALLHKLLPLEKHILLVSGRASFEIMQKALAARIPCVAAVSAPSSLAVEFARESNQTLVGFLRGNTMNVYSVPERIHSLKPTKHR